AGRKHQATERVRDPVCGMNVDPTATPHHAERAGRRYFFCSVGCRDRFLAEPARYLSGVGATSEAGAITVAAGATWTCPMHPEIIRDAPGACPICGMALEPRVPALHEGPDPELVDMTRRFWTSVVFTLPLFVIAMAPMLGITVIGGRARVWVELALALPVCTWAAWPFYVRFAQSLENKSPNMFTLIGLGVGVAFLYSLVAAVA